MRAIQILNYDYTTFTVPVADTAVPDTVQLARTCPEPTAAPVIQPSDKVNTPVSGATIEYVMVAPGAANEGATNSRF